MLQFTLQFLILLSGWRCRIVFLSLDWWSCDVKLIPCLRGCKLEPSLKDSLSWSRSLFSAWIFKKNSLKIHKADLARSTHQTLCLFCGVQRDLIVKIPPHKVKLPLSFWSTFRKWPSRSLLWKPSPSVSIKSTIFDNGMTPSFPWSILSNTLAVDLEKYESGI